MAPASDIDNRGFIKQLANIECDLVRQMVDNAGWLSKVDESGLRWALSLARVSAVEIHDQKDQSAIEIGHATDVYREKLFKMLSPFCQRKWRS